VKNKISKSKLVLLKLLFLEAKWFTNYVIARGIMDVDPKADYKVKVVQVKVGDGYEDRGIRALSSQMRQALIKRLQNNVRGLAKAREKGVKVGRIRFVRAVHSIPLVQYGITYWIDDGKRKVHIQGVGDFRVSGLDQIPGNAEFSSANLVERNGDYYLYVTCYLPNEQRPDNGKAIGIDLGVKDQVAFSNGVKLRYSVPVSRRLRRLYHFFSRARPGSRNREKLLSKIEGEFEKRNDVKGDIINKIVHFITTSYSYVVFQGDDIRSWQKLFGRRIQETSIGGLRDALERKASTPIEVPRFVKTTGVCPNCGFQVGLNLSDRVLACPSCGSVYDRDVASAVVILKEGLCLWDAGETPRDEDTSAMVEYLGGIPHVSVSMNWEAPSARAG
jgi:putative transposase